MKHNGVFVSSSGISLIGQEALSNVLEKYITTLRAAGIELRFCPYELDERRSTRALRKLWPSSYFRLAEQGLIGRVQAWWGAKSNVRILEPGSTGANCGAAPRHPEIRL